MSAEPGTTNEEQSNLSAGERLAREMEDKAQRKAAERGRKGEQLQQKAIDKFSLLSGKLFDQRRTVAWIVVIGIALIALACFGYFWLVQQREHAAQELVRVLKAHDEAVITEQSRSEELAAYAKLAQEHAGSKVGAWAGLAKARGLLDAGKAQEATQVYRDALNEAKGDATMSWLALTGLVYAFEAQEKYDEARTQLEAMRQLGPYYAMLAEYHNGRLLERMGKLDEARKIWTALQARLEAQKPTLPSLQADVAKRLIQLGGAADASSAEEIPTTPSATP